MHLCEYVVCGDLYSEWHNETRTHPTIYETEHKCQPNSKANKLIHEPTHERMSTISPLHMCVCVLGMAQSTQTSAEIS